ncbi:MAG: FtsX-like permease family protein [Coprobacillaceae bacterium]
MAFFNEMVGFIIEIRTLLKANIKHRKGTFLSLVILMFIITVTLVSIISVNDNQETNLEKAEIADIVYFIKNEYVSDEMLSILEENKNTETVTKTSGLYFNSFIVNDTKSPSTYIATTYEQSNTKYPVISENALGYSGTNEALKEGEIYLPLGTKELLSCDIGDEMIVSTNDGNESFTIKGFVEEPFLGAYFMGMKQFFISDVDFERLSNSVVEGNPNRNIENMYFISLVQDKNSDLSITEYQKEINMESKIIDFSTISMRKDVSMGYTLVFNQIITGVLMAFIILLFIVIIIVMGHSITTSIEIDYVNLGILKAQGFTKQKLYVLLTLQYTLSLISGTILGFIIAIPLTKILGTMFQSITGILSSASISIIKCLLLIFAIIMMCGLFILYQTRRIGKISPVRAISNGRESIHFDHVLQLPIHKKGLHFRLALRQFTSNVKQYISTISIITILVYFMMSMTILSNCITPVTIEEQFGDYIADIDVQLNDDFTVEDIPRIEKTITKITSISKIYYGTSRYLTVEGSDYHTSIMQTGEMIHGLLDGRLPEYDNELVITEILAEELEKKIGDSVVVSYHGDEAEYIITGFIQKTSDSGRCLAMPLAAANRLEDISLRIAYLSIDDAEQIDKVTKTLNDTYSSILKAEVVDAGTFSMIETAIQGISILIYSVSIIFMIVVISMVCSKIFLKEKQDIGIFKSVGFSVSALRLQFAIRFLLIACIGSFLGTIFCILFNNQMMNVLLRGVGISSFTTEYTVVVIFLPILLVCVCSFVFAYFISNKVKKVEVKDLIVA